MDAIVATGLFTLGAALGGVAVGGFVSAGSERRARLHEAALAEAKRIRALRAAARLVTMELDEARVAAVWAERERRWWLQGHLSTALWEQQRGLLAVELPPEEWKLVDHAYYSVAALNLARAAATADDPVITPLGLNILEGGTDARLQLAIDALAKHDVAAA